MLPRTTGQELLPTTGGFPAPAFAGKELCGLVTWIVRTDGRQVSFANPFVATCKLLHVVLTDFEQISRFRQPGSNCARYRTIVAKTGGYV